MQLVHTTFALRFSYEQRFACDSACGPWACILVGVTIYRRHRIGLEVTLLDQFDSNDIYVNVTSTRLDEYLMINLIFNSPAALQKIECMNDASAHLRARYLSVTGAAHNTKSL